MEIVEINKITRAYLEREDIVAKIKINKGEMPKIEDIRKVLTEKLGGEIIINVMRYERNLNTIKVLAKRYLNKEIINKLEPQFIIKKNYGGAEQKAA